MLPLPESPIPLSRQVLTGGEGAGCTVSLTAEPGRFAAAAYVTDRGQPCRSSIPRACLSPVNGTKLGKQMVENFSPNQTKFTVQRADPVSRYRFTLSARTQVGSGEAVTEESPASPNEGRCIVGASGSRGPANSEKTLTCSLAAQPPVMEGKGVYRSFKESREPVLCAGRLVSRCWTTQVP